MKCPNCGFEQEERDVCEMCGIIISAYLKRQQEKEAVEGLRDEVREVKPALTKSIPWEDRASLGFIKALISTLKESLFSPTQFFKKMPTTGGFGKPINYAIVVTWIGLFGAFVWAFLVQALISLAQEGVGAILLGFALTLLILIILPPIFVPIGSFIGSGILHLLMILVGGAKNGFEATFRAMAYSYGTMVFNLVPFIGGLVGGPWTIVLQIIGLREAHETTTGKASLAVLIPVVTVFVLTIIAVLIFIGIIATGIMASQGG